MLVAVKDGYVPIKPIAERTIESKRTGALATIAQKTDTLEGELVMCCYINIGIDMFQVHNPGTKVILEPNAAFQPWNKTVYEVDGVSFVKAPLSAILAVRVQT